jgi:hypothetical protein
MKAVMISCAVLCAAAAVYFVYNDYLDRMTRAQISDQAARERLKGEVAKVQRDRDEKFSLICQARFQIYRSGRSESRECCNEQGKCLSVGD